MEKILVSACLLGSKVRYNGSDFQFESNVLEEWGSQGRIVPFCPEICGGLTIPRPSAEIQGQGGEAVLDGEGHVINIKGHDVTAAFIEGAMKALEAARENKVKLSILKENSPSCGSSTIYDGTFTGTLKSGHGVTAALFERNGIRVFSEKEIQAAAEYLEQIERSCSKSFKSFA